MLFDLRFVFNFLAWQGVFSYFSVTHYRLGNLLKDQLELSKNKVIRQEITKYVDIQKLGDYSNWADKVKRRPEYAWSKHHHYIDLPSKWCDKPEQETLGWHDVCENDCIMTSILNITNDLRYNRDYLSQSEIVDGLSFLIHHFQDFHQPLHVYGDDRGGNEQRITLDFGNKKTKTNLHTLWDKYMPETHWPVFVGNNTKITQKTPITMFDYQTKLSKHLTRLFKLACRVTAFTRTTHKNVIVLNFTEYYNHSQDVMTTLFNDYLDTLIFTFRFVFEKNESGE